MRIVYSDGVTSITMPQSKPYELGGENEGRLVVLAGGRERMKMRGHRIVFTVAWSWVPQEMVEALVRMLRANAFIQTTYYDPVLGIVTKPFSLSYPMLSTFRFVDGVPRWKDVSITHRSQELIRNG